MMNTTKRISLAIGTLLFLATGFAAGQLNPEIYSPVILGHDKTAATPIELRPDGTGLRDLTVSGNLSAGAAGHRWFLQNVNDGSQFFQRIPLEDGSVFFRPFYTDLVALGEGGNPRMALTTDHYIQRGPARWSNDGRIAYVGVVWDMQANTEGTSGLDGHALMVGLFLADVTYSGEIPVVANERMLAGRAVEDSQTVYYLDRTSVSWSSDGQQILLYLERSVYQPNGSSLIYPQSYVVRMDAPSLCGFTVDGAAVNAQLAPDGSGRAAFTRSASGDRKDLYMTNVPAGIGCGSDLSSQPLTSAASKLYRIGERGDPGGCSTCFGWSPDGQWIGFHAYAGSSDTASNLYKIRSSGGKPVALTTLPAKRVTGGYAFLQWAR
jgi:hypothetical protein